MADSDGKVRIIIDTNADKAAQELDKLGNAFNDTAKEAKNANSEFNTVANDGMKTQISSIGNLTGALKTAVGAFVGIRTAQMAFNYAMQSVDAYRVQERAIASLNIALQNAGVYTSSYSQQIQTLASEIQRYSNYGDEAVIKAVALGQAFAGQVPFTQSATKAIVDFAAATGMDLEQAFSLAGKSIGTSTNALSRYGVELKKGMTESQKMEAITAQLSARYKGSAEVMADASVQLKNAVGDLSEAIGGVLAPAVTGITNRLRLMAEAATDAINRMRLLQTENAKLGTLKNAADKGIELQGELYRLNADYKQGKTTTANFNKRKAELEQEIKFNEQWQQVYAKRQLAEEKAAKAQKPVNANASEFSSGGGGGGGRRSGGGGGGSAASSAKITKDAFEQAQEQAMKAEKAFKSALYSFGANSQQAEAAKESWLNAKNAVDEVNNEFSKLTTEVQNVGPYQALQDKINTLKTELLDLAAAGQSNTDKFKEMVTEYQTATQELDNVNKTFTQAVTTEWQSFTGTIASSLSSAILTPLQAGENYFQRFANVGLNIINQIATKLLTNAIEQLLTTNQQNVANSAALTTKTAELGIEQAITAQKIEQLTLQQAINAASGGGAAMKAGTSAITTALTSFMGSEKGNVFKGGKVLPFRKGGIVNTPTVFPMADGGTGLMGEAGAEAVMPLRRMSNGRLGVEADTKNDKKGVVVNIYNQSGAQVETRKKDDGSMDIFIRKVNAALSSERTSSGFRAAYSREDKTGVQAV